MSSAPKTPQQSGFFSMIVMACLLIAGYSYYLISTQQHLDYQADALAPNILIMKPGFVIGLIAKGGFLGTLTAVLLHVVHSIFYAIIAWAATTAVVGYLTKGKQSPTGKLDPTSARANGEYDAEIAGSEVMIMIAGRQNKQGRTKEPDLIDKTPYRQVFFRIQRKVLNLSRQPVTPIEKLYVALHSMLAEHPDVPASIGAHHADTSLLNHSLAISKALVERMQEKGWPEPLARVAGIAHDMDKLLAYTKKGNSWVKTKDCTHHNTFSAYIASNQPEFKELDKDDKRVLTLALRYYHHPQMLPSDCGPRVERLVDSLRFVDGFITRNEKQDGIAKAKAGDRTSTQLQEGLIATINGLNINCYLGGNLAGGWTKAAYEYVIIPMSAILENIGSHIPAELSRQLQVSIDSRSFHHPAIDVLLESLEDMGLLMHDYKEMHSDRGLFDVKIGAVPFAACLLLHKERIEELLPTTVIKWGMAKYMIKIRKPTESILAEDDDSEE